MRTDVAIVGGGAAGLLAAVVARRLGHSVVVVEGSRQLGGATAGGDGHLWMPGNDLAGHGGLPADSADDALQYLTGLVGPTDDAARARLAAFARTAAVVARWLVSSRIALDAVKGPPDCRAEADGGKPQGRTLRARGSGSALDDDWAERLRPAADSGDGAGLWGWLRRPFARKDTPGGAALVTELLRRALSSGVQFWLNAPMRSLLVRDDAVAGVVVDLDGAEVTLEAGRGVLLACGGFEGDQALREEHLPTPTSTDWSLGGGNDGSALRVAEQVSAATAGLDRAWWTPVLLAEGRPYPLDAARTAPHGMIVDAAGDRYLNEAEPGSAVGRRMYEHNRGQRSVPSFLVLDNRHRKAHALGPWPAGNPPKAALEADEVVKGSTLNELGENLGVDRAGLLGSMVAFNALAKRGKDTDLKRGDSAWDRFLGDPLLRRNPCLGGVDKAPFWGVRIYPGDEGTAGGLVIDERSRVVRGDGAPVPGLWACGGAAASVFGGVQPGSGAALAAALVEAYRAVVEMSDQLDRVDEALG